MYHLIIARGLVLCLYIVGVLLQGLVYLLLSPLHLINPFPIYSAFGKYSDNWLIPHFVTLHPYSKIDLNCFLTSSIYTQYPIMTKKIRCLELFANVIEKKLILHLNKYSDPLLSTLLKHLWQRLQPRVLLGKTLQARHICIGEILPFFSVDPLKLCCTTIFRALQRCYIVF